MYLDSLHWEQCEIWQINCKSVRTSDIAYFVIPSLKHTTSHILLILDSVWKECRGKGNWEEHVSRRKLRHYGPPSLYYSPLQIPNVQMLFQHSKKKWFTKKVKNKKENNIKENRGGLFISFNLAWREKGFLWARVSLGLTLIGFICQQAQQEKKWYMPENTFLFFVFKEPLAEFKHTLPLLVYDMLF